MENEAKQQRAKGGGYAELRDKLEALEARDRRRGRVMAALLGCSLVAGVVTAGAQVSEVSGLYAFSSGDPARADQVNHNFAKLQEWIVAKVGGVDSAQIEVANGAGVDMVFDNNAIVAAKNSAGVEERFLWPRYSNDVTYLNYGENGFRLRNNDSEDKLVLDGVGNVIVKESMKFDCPGCGDATDLNGESNWGDLTIQGRVLSTSANLHLSPPGGKNVVINGNFRAAGGTKDGKAGLSVEGDITYGGKLSGWRLSPEVTNNWDGPNVYLTTDGSESASKRISSSDGVCFLTYMMVDHQSCDPHPMMCHVRLDGDQNWYIDAREGGGCDTNTDCRARCIVF